MSDTVAEWKPSDASRARTAAALAKIDASHIAWPTCRLCGQRVGRLDPFWLCSKTSPAHQRARGIRIPGGRQ